MAANDPGAFRRNHYLSASGRTTLDRNGRPAFPTPASKIFLRPLETAAAVASNLAGARHAVSIDDVLEAVSALDRDPSRSPGRKLFRQKSTSRVALAA
jgi:hypothetical protein